jgi:hypothetical protein
MTDTYQCQLVLWGLRALHQSHWQAACEAHTCCKGCVLYTAAVHAGVVAGAGAVVLMLSGLSTSSSVCPCI